jgi:tetratricopeptide (TPR) repeat protein
LLELLSKRLVGLTARRLGFSIGLWGPAGIGKTQTASKLLHSSPSRFQTVQASSSIKTLTNIVRGSKKLPGVIQRNVERLQNNESLEHHTLMNVFAAMLGSQAPFVLLIEDLHEANAEQLEFWYGLAKLVKALAGVGLIYTSRSAFIEPIENVALEPLDAGQSQRLIEDHLRAKIPKAAHDWIFYRCAGNPLFTLEFADFLTNHDALWNDGRTWKWREPLENTLPNTVEAIIGKWLTDLTLNTETRAVLETKAYFETRTPGQYLDDRTWAVVCQLQIETFYITVQKLEDFEVLQNKVFRHPLYREVTVQNLDATRRKTLALQMLQCFSGTQSHLILPFFEEAQLELTLALSLLEQSAKQAETARNKSDAGRLLARAAEIASGERAGQFAFEAAMLLKWIDSDAALKLAELAAQTLGANTDALLLMAELKATQGNISDVTTLLDRVPDVKKRGLAWAERLVSLYRNANQFEKMFQVFHDFPEVEMTENLGTLSVMTMFLMSQKEHDWALRIGKKAQRLEKSNLSAFDRMKFLDIQSYICRIEKNYVQNETIQTQVIEVSINGKMPLGTSQAFSRRGHARLQLAKEILALSDFENALRIAKEIGHFMAYFLNKLEVARIQMLTAEFEKAEKNLLEAATYFEQHSIPWIFSTYYSLVQLYIVWDRKYTKSLVEHYGNKIIERWKLEPLKPHEDAVLRVKADLALQQNNPEAALEIAKELLQKTFDTEGYIVRAQALVALQRPNEAIQAYQQALIAARDEADIRQEQLIGLELDNLSRDISSARERLEVFKTDGLIAYVNRVLRYFPELLETTISTASTTNLENLGTLEVLGQMRIKLNGKTEVVRGQKRQELLASLLIARMEGQLEIKVDDLREALYPDHNLKDGSNALRQTIHKIRSSCSQNLILTTSQGYALGNINSDAELFLKDGNTTLWSDTFFNGLQLDAGDSILENLTLRLHSRATDLLEHNPKEAVRIAGILLISNPYDLEALRLQCLGLRQLGQHASLKRIYQKARISFLEIGEHLPETWAKFLEV